MRPLEVVYTRQLAIIECHPLPELERPGSQEQLWAVVHQMVLPKQPLRFPAAQGSALPVPASQPPRVPRLFAFIFVGMVSDLLSYLGIFSGTLRAGPCRHTGDRAHDVSRRLSARRRAHRRIITEIRILRLLQSVGFT